MLQDILSMASVYHKKFQRILNTRNHEGANTNPFPCKGIALTHKHWQFLIVHDKLLLMCVCWFSNHFSTAFAIFCCINNSSKVGFARSKTPWWNPCKEKACCPGKESLVPQIAAQKKLDLHGDYSSVSIHSVTLTWYSSLIFVHMHLQPNLKLIILNQHKTMKNIMLACRLACLHAVHKTNNTIIRTSNSILRKCYSIATTCQMSYTPANRKHRKIALCCNHKREFVDTTWKLINEEEGWPSCCSLLYFLHYLWQFLKSSHMEVCTTKSADMSTLPGFTPR